MGGSVASGAHEAVVVVGNVGTANRQRDAQSGDDVHEWARVRGPSFHGSPRSCPALSSASSSPRHAYLLHSRAWSSILAVSGPTVKLDPGSTHAISRPAWWLSGPFRVPSLHPALAHLRLRLHFKYKWLTGALVCPSPSWDSATARSFALHLRMVPRFFRTLRWTPPSFRRPSPTSPPTPPSSRDEAREPRTGPLWVINIALSHVRAASICPSGTLNAAVQLPHQHVPAGSIFHKSCCWLPGPLKFGLNTLFSILSTLSPQLFFKSSTGLAIGLTVPLLFSAPRQPQASFRVEAGPSRGMLFAGVYHTVGTDSAVPLLRPAPCAHRADCAPDTPASGSLEPCLYPALAALWSRPVLALLVRTSPPPSPPFIDTHHASAPS
ncbi:hypothetical protein MSAN_01539200 [Mycena sanguinolenta]|uniref:Uncharacterized protein n=1 Tax=Mycena sanguinolenta TaxID=230812 RepID=A0A8H6Y7V0_9AGAR|nr:hypothetical protein MSAN_01539200 [Mycena sanguinolenta]